MVDLSGDTSLKTQFAGAESKFWDGLAPTWKFKVGRFFERLVFGAVRRFLFFLAKVYIKRIKTNRYPGQAFLGSEASWCDNE